MFTEGRLQPSDLLWRDGMPEWKAARTVQGFFDDSKERWSDDQPPLHQNPAATNREASRPALWNPAVIFAWSFILTPAFGSFLIRKNWKVLEEGQKAQRAMYWFIGVLGFYVAGIFASKLASHTIFSSAVSWGLWAAWLIAEAAPHIDYARKSGKDGYSRKPWWPALGFGFSGLALYLVIATGWAMLQQSATDL